MHTHTKFIEAIFNSSAEQPETQLKSQLFEEIAALQPIPNTHCPKCGEQTIVRPSKDTYHCINCGYEHRLRRKKYNYQFSRQDYILLGIGWMIIFALML